MLDVPGASRTVVGATTGALVGTTLGGATGALVGATTGALGGGLERCGRRLGGGGRRSGLGGRRDRERLAVRPDGPPEAARPVDEAGRRVLDVAVDRPSGHGELLAAVRAHDAAEELGVDGVGDGNLVRRDRRPAGGARAGAGARGRRGAILRVAVQREPVAGHDRPDERDRRGDALACGRDGAVEGSAVSDGCRQARGNAGLHTAAGQGEWSGEEQGRGACPPCGGERHGRHGRNVWPRRMADAEARGGLRRVGRVGRTSSPPNGRCHSGTAAYARHRPSRGPFTLRPIPAAVTGLRPADGLCDRR